jgi:hypothetical protein
MVTNALYMGFVRVFLLGFTVQWSHLFNIDLPKGDVKRDLQEYKL